MMQSCDASLLNRVFFPFPPFPPFPVPSSPLFFADCNTDVQCGKGLRRGAPVARAVVEGHCEADERDAGVCDIVARVLVLAAVCDETVLTHGGELGRGRSGIGVERVRRCGGWEAGSPRRGTVEESQRATFGELEGDATRHGLCASQRDAEPADIQNASYAPFSYELSHTYWRRKFY